MPNFQAIKFPESIKINNVTITKLIFRLFWILKKNPYLNQAAQKNTCSNFPNPKNPEIKYFKPPKLLQSSLSLEIQSTSLGLRYSSIEGSLEFNPFSRIVWFNSSKKCFLRNLKSSRVQASIALGLIMK